MSLRAVVLRAAGAAALAAAVLAGPATVPASARPAVAPASTQDEVAITVTDMTPTSIAPTAPGTLTVTLQLRNLTDQDLDPVSVMFRRGAPIDDERAFDSALSEPQASAASLSTSPKYRPLGAPLRAGQTTTLAYTATVSPAVTSDICLCKDGTVYPLEFTALVDGATAGYTQTYLPAFERTPAAVPVGWVWPILDRPHRLNDPTVFTDDALATSLAAGGRLDRVLGVAEAVPAAVRLTLQVDPELVDEIAVMSAGSYRVSTASGTVAGSGAEAATAWLARLRALVGRDDVSLTPWGDPDVNALTAAGLPWPTAATPAEQARVAAVLGGSEGSARPDSSVYWPPGTTITPDALARAASWGARTVVVDDRTLTGGATGQPRPSSLARLPSSGTLAAVTDAATERLVDAALTAADPASGVPALVSRVALRTAEVSRGSGRPAYLVLTPDRYVDPDVARATRAITDTTTSFFTTSLPVGAASASLSPVDRGGLQARPGAGESSLPTPNVEVAQRALGVQATVTSAVAAADAAAVVGGLPLAVRGVESAWWRADRSGAVAYAAAVGGLVGALERAVSIVQPAEGSYTLGSSDSFLFVTIANTLPAPATVRLSITTVGGVAGFRADDATEQVPAGTRLTVKVAVHAERSGRFKVLGTLRTPSGQPVGDQLRVTVNSTSLGGIGVVITEVAAGVLALALCLRVVRRIRAGRRPVGRS